MKTISRDFCKMKQFNVKKLIYFLLRPVYTFFITSICTSYILHLYTDSAKMVLAEAVLNTTSNAYFWKNWTRVCIQAFGLFSW